MRLELPFPPSSNRYWRVFRGRPIVSREARAYKLRVATEAKVKHSLARPLAGPLSVLLAVYRPQRRGDLDNALKVTLDALNGIAWEDDSQIEELHAMRFEDKANPRVVVTVEPIHTAADCDAPDCRLHWLELGP